MGDPNIDDLVGTRCQDCGHFRRCDFEDRDEARTLLGQEAVAEIMGLYGICTYDPQDPDLVSCDLRMHDVMGADCWNSD